MLLSSGSSFHFCLPLYSEDIQQLFVICSNSNGPEHVYRDSMLEWGSVVGLNTNKNLLSRISMDTESV